MSDASCCSLGGEPEEQGDRGTEWVLKELGRVG